MEFTEICQKIISESNWNTDLFDSVLRLPEHGDDGRDREFIIDLLESQGLSNSWASRIAEHNKTRLVTLEDIEEEDVEWVLPGYIPKSAITILAGDGGLGKTSLWVNIISAISAGQRSILEYDVPDFAVTEPSRVMFFSAEDSLPKVLRRKLRVSGANMKNIVSLDLSDSRFSEITFNSTFLGELLENYKPVLCVFDPLQAFLGENIDMSRRNQMRRCLEKLIGWGEKYGTAFLIICHTNKSNSTTARGKIADSADIWDIARSVLFLGSTLEQNVRYISQEKNNYAPLAATVEFIRDGDTLKFKEGNEKRFSFYAREAFQNNQKDKENIREFCKREIMQILEESDGEIEVQDLHKKLKDAGFTQNNIRYAKSDLRQDGVIKYHSTGAGAAKKHFISSCTNKCPTSKE